MSRIWQYFGASKEGRPVVANLGTSNQMYFNKELNRWVEPGQEDEIRKEMDSRKAPPPKSSSAPSEAPTPASLESSQPKSAADLLCQPPSYTIGRGRNAANQRKLPSMLPPRPPVGDDRIPSRAASAVSYQQDLPEEPSSSIPDHNLQRKASSASYPAQPDIPQQHSENPYNHQTQHTNYLINHQSDPSEIAPVFDQPAHDQPTPAHDQPTPAHDQPTPAHDQPMQQPEYYPPSHPAPSHASPYFQPPQQFDPPVFDHSEYAREFPPPQELPEQHSNYTDLQQTSYPTHPVYSNGFLKMGTEEIPQQEPLVNASRQSPHIHAGATPTAATPHPQTISTPAPPTVLTPGLLTSRRSTGSFSMKCPSVEFLPPSVMSYKEPLIVDEQELTALKSQISEMQQMVNDGVDSSSVGEQIQQLIDLVAGELRKKQEKLEVKTDTFETLHTSACQLDVSDCSSEDSTDASEHLSAEALNRLHAKLEDMEEEQERLSNQVNEMHKLRVEDQALLEDAGTVAAMWMQRSDTAMHRVTQLEAYAETCRVEVKNIGEKAIAQMLVMKAQYEESMRAGMEMAETKIAISQEMFLTQQVALKAVVKEYEEKEQRRTVEMQAMRDSLTDQGDSIQQAFQHNKTELIEKTATIRQLEKSLRDLEHLLKQTEEQNESTMRMEISRKEESLKQDHQFEMARVLKDAQGEFAERLRDELARVSFELEHTYELRLAEFKQQEAANHRALINEAVEAESARQKMISDTAMQEYLTNQQHVTEAAVRREIETQQAESRHQLSQQQLIAQEAMQHQLARQQELIDEAVRREAAKLQVFAQEQLAQQRAQADEVMQEQLALQQESMLQAARQEMESVQAHAEHQLAQQQIMAQEAMEHHAARQQELIDEAVRQEAGKQQAFAQEQLAQQRAQANEAMQQLMARHQETLDQALKEEVSKQQAIAQEQLSQQQLLASSSADDQLAKRQELMEALRKYEEATRQIEHLQSVHQEAMKQRVEQERALEELRLKSEETAAELKRSLEATQSALTLAQQQLVEREAENEALRIREDKENAAERELSVLREERNSLQEQLQSSAPASVDMELIGQLRATLAEERLMWSTEKEVFTERIKSMADEMREMKEMKVSSVQSSPSRRSRDDLEVLSQKHRDATFMLNHMAMKWEQVINEYPRIANKIDAMIPMLMGEEPPVE